MDFLKTLLAYMATTLVVAVESTSTPVVTPIPTPAPTASIVETAVRETATMIPVVTPSPEPTVSVTPAPVPLITPNTRGYHNLLQGDRGEEVRRLQEKLIGGMTERIDALRRQGAWAQDEINRVFYEYLSAHRRQMELLLSVRSENLDLEKQMRDLFARYLAASGSRLSDLERELLSEIIVRSVVYHIRQGTSMENLSDIMLDTWLNMSVYFYRLERHEDAREQLLSLVKKLHTGHS